INNPKLTDINDALNIFESPFFPLLYFSIYIFEHY
ncbi:hypothetical protein SASC598P14_001030, partial [Snodgrassella alvi SCGC AB-598-P14]